MIFLFSYLLLGLVIAGYVRKNHKRPITLAEWVFYILAWPMHMFEKLMIFLDDHKL